MTPPYILLDDARAKGAADARLYRDPVELVTAYRPDEVEPALDRLRQLHGDGYELAGFIAYEAGLCLEEKLRHRASARTGGAGPLIWFGAFSGFERIPAADMPAWFARRKSDEPVSIGPLEPQISPGQYGRDFDQLKQAILAGDVYQANLTFALSGSWRGDPVDLYAAIRPSAQAGYGGIIHDGADWLLSFSPELFFSLKGESAMAKPMKGTRPRGRTAEEDRAWANDLTNSEKDRAENLMIVDLMRNDLSRVSRPGSVRVENAFAVESYPTVHQMVSTIRADLKPGFDAIDMFRALFPCGSITGTPKIRAMELIDSLERDPRGPYCGAIGRIDASGDAAFNVAIRTLRLSAQENGTGRAVLGVGSAIVADSQAMPEWRECVVKGGFVRQSSGQAAAAQFDLIETMAFMPETGVGLLEFHLERIKASAAELGFIFDRHAVRNAVQALCFEADKPSKLRLAASRSGAYSLELSDMPAQLREPAHSAVLCAVLPLPVDEADWRLRHKTSDRGFYEAGLAAAQAEGAQEAIFLRDDGLVTEGCFTNIFVERDGQLLTPPASLGLLPGVLRRSLIEQGRAIEAKLTLDDLSGGFLIGNALRGLITAELLT